MGKRSREKRERREKGEIEPRPEREDLLSSIFLKIIKIGTYLILFTPFIISGKFFFPFVGPKSIYFFALVEIIFFAYIFLAIFWPKYRPKFNILLVALILFLVISILAAFFGADFFNSFWSKYERMTGLLMLFHLFAFFLVISSVFQKKDWSKFFGVSVMAAVLMSIITLFAKVDINLLGELGASSREGATLGNSSFLATYLLFNIFLALYLFLKAEGGFKIFSGVGFILIALALFLSTGRAAVFCFFVGVILLFFLRLIFLGKGALKFAGIFLLTIFALGGITGMFFATQPDNIVHKVVVQQTSLSTVESRLVVWQIGLKGLKEKPWLGWGPENFDLVFAKHFDSRIFLPEYGTDIWYDRAHNFVIDTLVATGIIGFLSYLGIFFSVFYILWRKYFRRNIDFLTAGIFSALLISYSIQNLTVFDMVSSYMMLFLILGFVGSIISERESDPPPPVSPYKKATVLNLGITIIILIFFCFSFFKFVIQPFRANQYVIKAFETPNLTERISLYKKTLETSPVSKYQIREYFADAPIKLSLQEDLETIQKEGLKEELDFVAQEIEKSIEESPLRFSSYLKLGEVYNAYTRIDASKLPQAEEILEKAIKLSPANQQGYWGLAQTKLYQRELDEAISLAEKAVELEPKVEKSHLVLIQISKMIRDEDLVREKVQEALEINPSWQSDIEKIFEQ